MEDWTFPVEYTAIEGDTVVIKWTQITPGARADGSQYRQSGYSTLLYAGNGKFSYEEDLLNMVHVFEDMKASGFRVPPEMGMPPKHPNRDFRIEVIDDKAQFYSRFAVDIVTRIQKTGEAGIPAAWRADAASRTFRPPTQVARASSMSSRERARPTWVSGSDLA